RARVRRVPSGNTATGVQGALRQARTTIMKKAKRKIEKTHARGMTRREFVGTTALAAAGVMAGAPAILRGRDLNGKLDIAFIACGGRAEASLSELTILPGRARGPGPSQAAPPPAPHPHEDGVLLLHANHPPAPPA